MVLRAGYAVPPAKEQLWISTWPARQDRMQRGANLLSLQIEDIARLALRRASLESRFTIHPCYEDTMAKKAKKAKKAAKKTKKKSKKK